MKSDGRDVSRIERAIDQSRKAYDGISYKKIDITKLSIYQAATTILTDAALLMKKPIKLTDSVLLGSAGWSNSKPR